MRSKTFLKFSKESWTLMNNFQFIESNTLKFKDFDTSIIKNKQIIYAIKLKKLNKLIKIK
jgi:hypothetical protein